MRVAVIGSGIAGLGAAWASSRVHDVTLFESEDTVGGHSRTLEVDVSGDQVAVDTGFIVYNERNYPNLTRLFAELGVETAPSDMSFAVSARDGSLEYAGRTAAMFPSPASLVDRRLWQVVRGIARFRTEADRLASGLVPEDVPIGAYLDERGYPAGFAEHYLMPLAAAVWSGTRNHARSMPARSFLGFLDNHGLIDLSDRPAWRTVRGGSHEYVKRIAKEITSVHERRPVVAVTRVADGVEVRDAFGSTELFDHVVIATHADTALALRGRDATTAEHSILGAFGYDRNEVVLHTDRAAMPRRRQVWSSWNAIERRSDDGTDPVVVSYWMNRLQPLRTRNDIFVTLNPGTLVDPSRVIDRWVAMHPQFDVRTSAAQGSLPSIQGHGGIWYAGAHLGHGFHEDGLQSGLTVAAALGAPAPWHEDIVPVSPAAVHAAPLRTPVHA